MPNFSYSQTQKAVQAQKQILSQKHIQSLKMLAMNSKDLKEEIQNVVKENHSLEIITSDNIEEKKEKRKFIPYDFTTTSYVTTAKENEASQKFQEAYENVADTAETLKEHLMFQLNIMKLSEDEKLLGQAIIYNLDNNGYHILSPITLLDKTRPHQTPVMLKKLINDIQQMEPEGVCCANMEESLLIQAKIKGDAPPLVLFILSGNIDLLYSNESTPNFEKITEKINKLQKDKVSLEDVRLAISYISKLNPKPASGYGKENVQYVVPDVIISQEEIESENEKTNTDSKVYVKISNNKYHVITFSKNTVPEVRLKKQLNASKKRITAATQFLENLAYRKALILKSCEIIVTKQKNYFLKNGKTFLEPFTQTQLSKILNVNDSTTSRMVNEKFIQTPWGQLFPLKYFFINSKDKVKYAIEQIIEETKDSKPLSDIKIVEKLSERGIKVARRTVAKYRTQLAISSSYKRK